MMGVNLGNETGQQAAHNALPRPNLVSVIIPCYNHAQFLSDAIESALAQSYSNFEIIVVDDGSTDNSPEVVGRYPRAQYLYQKNSGLSVARNAGLRQSRGEFLVFLDSDDRLLPHAFEIGIKNMRDHPECAFVSGHCRVIDSNGALLPSPKQLRVEREHYAQLLRAGTYVWCPATVLYQRRVFDFVGGFNPTVNPAADYDLYLRVTRDFPVYCHGEVVAEYRRHGLNMSRDVLRMQDAALSAHNAQWSFARANIHYRKALDAGTLFWQNDYPYQQMVSRIREIVRRQLPADATIAVATGGDSELLRLDGRPTWHFPQAEQGIRGRLFAQGADGSIAIPPWVEAGMAYEFSLYGGPEFSQLLSRLLIRGAVADPVPIPKTESAPEERLRENRAVLKAIPNPVPAGEALDATNIVWSTGDGSKGQVYVSGGSTYGGHDPAGSDEAWSSLESAKDRGAQYLLIPAKSFWWREHYQKFRRLVEDRYCAIVRDENTCVIFDLRESSQ